MKNRGSIEEFCFEDDYDTAVCAESFDSVAYL